MDITDRLVDLHKQATTERSHFYVASVVKDALTEIIALRLKVSVMQAELVQNQAPK